MKTKHLLLVVLTVLIFNCQNKASQKTSDPVEKEEVTLLDTLKLKLNNGNKWVANKETHLGIKNMDSIINEFRSSEEQDFIALGTALSKQTSFVIKNCSMKGEPHDQLHVVLVPMLDEITRLKEANNDEENNMAISTLDALIKDYFTHFKI